MEHGAIELRSQAGDIAERNEEINRRRLAGGGGARSGGPLRVTDPAALARLMAEMRAKAEQQRAAEIAREEERRRREGDAYQTPEQRAETARAARAAADEGREAGEEARVLEKRFDPAKDFYQILGLSRGASAGEVRKAYKKLALLFHPDKYRAVGEDERAAVADRFKLVVEAFDVLSNEEQRGVYDKCRDYMEANPGKGLPSLSPEEAALMRSRASGLAELSRLRRQGAKATKHVTLEKEVFVSLEKLNSGCTRTVAVERRRVAPDGAEFLSVINVHLVLRRGSREGDRHIFEDDGCKSVDTMPGDLALTLRQKPHPRYRRSGAKDLELFAGSLPAGDILFALEVATITGKRLLLTGSALRQAAANGGAGGTWQAVLPGHGLYDAAEPWEQPAGSLTVTLRYPACPLEEASITSCLAPQPVHLLGSAVDEVAGALAGGSVAGMLNHRREVAEMAEEERAAQAAAAAAAAEASGALAGSSQGGGCYSEGGSLLGGGEDGGIQASEFSSRGGSRRPIDDGTKTSSTGTSCGQLCGSSALKRCPIAVCLTVDCWEGGPDTAAPSIRARKTAAGCSPAAAAMLRVLRRRVPGLRAHVAAASCLLDEEWAALWQADVLILDMPVPSEAADLAADQATAQRRERQLAAAAEQLASCGLLEVLWQRFWAGCLVVGIGQACSLLGNQPLCHNPVTASGRSVVSKCGSAAPLILPWYLVRAGGGPSGWASLHAALAGAAVEAAITAEPAAAAEPAASQVSQAAATPSPAQLQPPQPTVGVGLVQSGCWVVHPSSGRAELLVAPCRDALVTTAAWAADPQNEPACVGLQEAEEEWGFFCELQAGAS